MWGVRQLVAAGMVAAGFGGWGGVARAEEYHDAARAITLEVPADWAVMTEREVKWRNALARDAWDVFDITFTAGFRPAGEALPEDHPFMLVQVDTEVKPGTAFDDFVKDYAAARRGAKQGYFESLLHTGHLSAVGEPTVDEKGQRIFSMYALGTDDRPRVHANYIHLGPDKLVVLHFFGTRSGWQKNKHLFVNLSDSLKFDSPTAAAAWGPLFGSAGDGVSRPVLIGGGVSVAALLIGLVVFATGRKAPPARQRW